MTIEVLVGMIASGKSTYARRRASEGAIVVNDDAIVAAVHGGEYKLYNLACKPLYKAIENQIVSLAVALGRDVVIDRGTDVGKKARARWITLASSLDVNCVAVEFRKEAAVEHARRRFWHDARGLPFETWYEVALRHEALYCPPTESEGFAAVIAAPIFSEP